MWTLRRPEALFELYEFRENPVILAHRSDALTWAGEMGVLGVIPYRFGMDLRKIVNAIPREPECETVDAVEVLFYLDRLEVTSGPGRRKILEVPQGINCKYFMRETSITAQKTRLVFVHSNPGNWCGIAENSFITVSPGKNAWAQQSWDEPGLIGDCLRNDFGFDEDVVYSWGNDPVELGMSANGERLDVASGSGGANRCVVPLAWTGKKWRVDRKTLREKRTKV